MAEGDESGCACDVHANSIAKLLVELHCSGTVDDNAHLDSLCLTVAEAVYLTAQYLKVVGAQTQVLLQKISFHRDQLLKYSRTIHF